MTTQENKKQLSRMPTWTQRDTYAQAHSCVELHFCGRQSNPEGKNARRAFAVRKEPNTHLGHSKITTSAFQREVYMGSKRRAPSQKEYLCGGYAGLVSPGVNSQDCGRRVKEEITTFAPPCRQTKVGQSHFPAFKGRGGMMTQELDQPDLGLKKYIIYQGLQAGSREPLKISSAKSILDNLRLSTSARSRSLHDQSGTVEDPLRACSGLAPPAAHQECRNALWKAGQKK